MCGIFAYIGKRDDAASLVLDGLKSLEYRGYDSWGISVVLHEDSRTQGLKDSKRHAHIVVKKRIGKIGDATVVELPASSMGFGHTRWATHGGVFEKNAHPHLDCSGRIAVIHNGIVENYEGLKVRLTKHAFKSDTDSEVVAHLLEDFTKKLPFPEAVRQTFLKLSGLNALIALQQEVRQLVAIRNGSPIVIGFGNKENFIASDAAAILPYTRRVYFLEDNEMAVVTDSKVVVLDAISGKEKTVTPTVLDWDIAASDKGNYDYFMLKEIHEQPDVIAQVAHEGEAQATELARLIRGSYGTYFVGCGTASYACITAGYLFSKIAKHHVNWAIGSEFSYHLDFLTDKSLVIALSQSGETMDILESIKAARGRGAVIAALVNVLGSTLYREADAKFLIGAGPEKGVASTKAFVGKLAHLLLTAYVLARQGDNGKKILTKAAYAGRDVLSEKNVSHIKKLVEVINTKKDMYIIGRGLSFPASLEAALKIKEISYIHAEGLAAGELKHGPLALIEKGTPCMVFAPLDETYGANLAGAMEMKARGGYIIGISPKKHEVFDYYLPVHDAGEATIIPSIMVAQLLAYYLAVSKGLDPDMPRNLAKSVTVK